MKNLGKVILRAALSALMLVLFSFLFRYFF